MFSARSFNVTLPSRGVVMGIMMPEQSDIRPIFKHNKAVNKSQASTVQFELHKST